MSEHAPGVAFLLAQVGAAAAARFAVAIEPLGLTPVQAGLLRQVQSNAGASQQELAVQLGTAPSRVVGHLDELERRGIVTRTPGADRRVNLVTLTGAGHALLADLGRVARAHDADIAAVLTAPQRDRLRALLEALAAGLDLSAGVHPGHSDRQRTGSARRIQTP